MAKDNKTQILASLQEIMGGQDAIKVASATILKALGEKPADLLRAKAAQYTQMAELIEACDSEEVKADDGALGEDKEKKPDDKEKK